MREQKRKKSDIKGRKRNRIEWKERKKGTEGRGKKDERKETKDEKSCKEETRSLLIKNIAKIIKLKCKTYMESMKKKLTSKNENFEYSKIKKLLI